MAIIILCAVMYGYVWLCMIMYLDESENMVSCEQITKKGLKNVCKCICGNIYVKYVNRCIAFFDIFAHFIQFIRD